MRRKGGKTHALQVHGLHGFVHPFYDAGHVTRHLSHRHGRLDPTCDGIDAAREAAERCGINILAQAQAALGDLDKIMRVVRLGGFFNVASSFDALPQAMNGASDLMANVFGERGRHARTTVGVAHLPMNALAEVEAVFEISF